MKKIIILVLVIFILSSCADPGGDPVFEGFEFGIKNRTNKKHSIEVVIGGMLNGKFVPTDSIKMQPEIEINGYPSYFTDENRWKPNLELIRAIPSQRCYFKIKLSDNREEMVGRFNQQELMSLLLPSGNFFIGNYGRLYFTIWGNETIGSAEEEL